MDNCETRSFPESRITTIDISELGLKKHQEIQVREYLKITVLMDHDVIDGAPAARFISRLNDLMKNAYGL